MQRPLEGRVALVTGASRGIGKGVALQLGEAGATVYITGRTMHSDDPNRGSLEQTANEIKKRGGNCIPVQVDHEKDEQVKGLFERIEKEQHGRLDILVNNAFKAVHLVLQHKNKKFWEMNPEMWDEFNNVGLRNHYFCTVYAARLMIPRKTGLVVFISSIGGTRYVFNTLYGVGKAAIDRMAMDCGTELKEHNVACVSLVLGPVHTETMDQLMSKTDEKETMYTDPMGCQVDADVMKEFMELAETTEFPGKCIVELALDPKIMKRTSKVIEAADYAQEKNIRDVDNRVVPSYRQINYNLLFVLPKQLHFVREFIPDFIKVPKVLFNFMNTKFV